MVQVGILYADLSQVWKPLSGVADFKKDGVLTITLTTERGNRAALCARMWSYQNNDVQANRDKAWWGEDKYAIGVMPDNTFFTTQWADSDEFLYARSMVDGSQTGRIARVPSFPAEAVVTIFVGSYLPPAEWEIALAKFERELF